MKTTVNKRDFLRVLARCQSVAAKKNTMPILSSVLIQSTGNELRLSATDLVIAFSGTVESDGSVDGSVAIGARDLFERVNAMPDGAISIESDDSTATIKAVGLARQYKLGCLPGEEFPSLPTTDGEGWIMLPVESMSRLISGTCYSVSTDESRPHLNCALFEVDSDTARMASTDGHRLSRVEIKSPDLSGKKSMLIPLKGVLELRRICSESDGEIKLMQSGPNLHCELSDFRLSVKLIDAQFPPYQQVIPESCAHEIKIEKRALVDALKAAEISADIRTGGVKLTLKNDTLKIESNSPASGQCVDELAVDYMGKELIIGLNAKYVLESVSSVNNDEITLGLSGELDPAVISDGEDGELLAVIMPMRV